MDFSFLTRYYTFFISGAKLTLFLAFFTVILGTILGLVLSLMRLSKSKVLSFIAAADVQQMRIILPIP